MSNETRTCSKCKQTLPIDNFWLKKKNGDKRRARCKRCQGEQNQQSEWNATKRKEYSRAYYASHKPSYERNRKAYYQRHPEEMTAYRKQYYLDNREVLLAQTRAYKDHKIQTDVAFKLECSMRARLSAVLGRIGMTKSDRTIKLLGCTTQQLKRHLEGLFYGDMSWDKWGSGPGTFQIDHIMPVGSFDLTNPTEQRRCFCYTNLQPLWWDDHQKKTKRDCRNIRAINAIRADHTLLFHFHEGAFRGADYLFADPKAPSAAGAVG